MNGITRGKLIELGHASGIVVREKNFSLTEVYDAEEAFVTGTFGGVTPVNTIDGREIGDLAVRPITNRMRELYVQAVEDYTKNGN